MSAVSDAIVAVLDAVPAVSGSVYIDRAPDPQAYPYVVVIDPLSNVPLLTGDRKVTWRRRRVQVDLWQTVAAADDTTAPAIIAALDGATLSVAGGGKVIRCRYQTHRRLLDPIEAVLHTAVDLLVDHNTVG